MKLWLIERKHYDYDEFVSCVILAKTENEAREIAKKKFNDKLYLNEWLDPLKIKL